MFHCNVGENRRNLMVFRLRELRTWMIDEDCGVYEMLQEIPEVIVHNLQKCFAKGQKN